MQMPSLDQLYPEIGERHAAWRADRTSVSRRGLGNENDGPSRRQTRRKTAIGFRLTRNIAILITLPRMRRCLMRVVGASATCGASSGPIRARDIGMVLH